MTVLDGCYILGRYRTVNNGNRTPRDVRRSVFERIGTGCSKKVGKKFGKFLQNWAKSGQKLENVSQPRGLRFQI